MGFTLEKDFTIKKSNYKWYILALTMLTYGVIAGLERMCLPVLFKQISTDLHLNVVSVGTIWGLDPLAGVFVGLPGGLLIDRFGIKRTMVVVCLLAGIFSALRGFSVNFVSMAAATFLFGMMAAVLPGIVPKTTAVWFNKEQLGLSNAFIFVGPQIFGMVATMTSATVLSPWLGGWRNVFFFLGAPAIIVGLLWLFTGREPEKQILKLKRLLRVPFSQALTAVGRNKEIWIIALITMLLWGANTGFTGYLPLYLRNIGWKPVEADGLLTAATGAMMAGSIPMTFLGGKLTGYKRLLLVSIILTIISMGLMVVIKGPAIWPLLIISNLLRSGASAATNVLVFEAPGVGSAYGGTAMGLVSSIGMAGAFISPPIGNSFANISPAMPFLFWAVLAALALPLFLFLKRPEKRQGGVVAASA